MTRAEKPDSATPHAEAWRSFRLGGLPDPPAPNHWARPAAEVARELLGSVLVSTVGGERTAGRIVETEAYTGADDPACHGARRIGRTERNRSMFGPAGHAYVYFIYGMHWCFNVVTGAGDDPQAVLIRALEPLEGRDLMAERRGRNRDLASGPARLCQALGIDGELDGHRLTREPLQLLPGPEPVPDGIRVSGRIGIQKARDWPLRFFLPHNPHVSSGPHLRLSRASRTPRRGSGSRVVTPDHSE